MGSRSSVDAQIAPDDTKPAAPVIVPSGGWTPRSCYMLGLLSFIAAFNYLDRSLLSLLIPQIKAEMEISDTMLGLVSGLAFTLFYSFMGVPIARLADATNRRNIVAVGLAFWSLMTALTGAVTNVWQLAATRFLMGAGEASNIAPSNSILADLFDRTRRPMALAIFTSSNAIASLVFFPLAGWIAFNYGWRVTFIAAGVPGLILAILLFTTTREPERGANEERRAGSRFSFREAISFLGGARSFGLVTAGGCTMGVSLNATVIWTPTFLERVHALDLTSIASLLGIVRGLAGVCGGLLAGLIIQRLSARDERWLLWVPAISAALSALSEIVFLLAETLPVAMIGLALVTAFNTACLGPIYAACMSIGTLRMRATVAALYLMIVNLIGISLGPLLAGFLNDALNPTFGAEAIRWSLLTCALFCLLSGALFWRAGFFLPRDSQRARTAEDGR